MKINKVIFAVNDSHYLDFWPTQAKICKEILNIEPVLFHITNENSDFYNDGHGLVKKIKKVDEINTGAQAAMGRMFFTKYFPEEVCLVADIDLISINRNYLQDQIKNFPSDSFIIYDSDAYNKKRPEADEYLKNEYLMGIKELFCYHANAGKGKTFNKLLNTNCTFEEYILRHQQIGNKDLFWGVDEYYFSKCILETNINIIKLKRGFTSPWIADKRIDRHRFPVNLEWQGEIEAQQKDGIYNFNNLKSDGIIDMNCPRPYSKYKGAIEEAANIILNK